MDKHLTGFPSVDRPWLTRYSNEAINNPLPSCSLYEYLYEKNHAHPEDIAIIYFDRKISYGELFSKIDALAYSFNRSGIKKGDCVIVCTLNTPEMVYCTYALNKIGAIVDYEYPTLSAAEMEEAIEATKAKTIILLNLFDEKFHSLNGKIQKVYISPADSFSPIKKFLFNLKKPELKKKSISTFIDSKAQNASLPKVPVNPDDPAIFVHTGGTTGVPKSVVLSNSCFNSISFQYHVSGMTYNRQDTILHCIPPFHAYGFSIGVHMPLTLGMTICMSIKIDSETISQLLLKYKPIHFVGSGPHVAGIINNDKIKQMDFSHMRTIAIGGAAIDKNIETDANKFLKDHNASCCLVVGYGMTETCATACTNMNHCCKVGSVGIPLSKVCVKVVDVDSGKELPYNKQGELWISSPGNMKGYFENENETNECIVYDEGKSWIRSGDLATIDEDGFVTIVGRIKRIFTTKETETGYLFKVYPEYIERIITQNEMVEECVVIPVSDPARVKKPVAHIVVKPGCKEKVKELEVILRKLCADKLPVYARPTAYIFRDTIPHTVIGKVDYKAMEEATK